MIGTGWALHGTLSVASPTQRRQVIQQLLQGDLADLADEKLHQLLPKIKHKPWAPKKWKNNQIHQQSQKQRNMVPGSNGKHFSVLKNTYPSLSMAKLGIDEDALCFISMEKNVSFELQRRHANGEMVHALKRAVFPELNLRSYLKCKSDLDLQTIRCLLRTRPTDEATELEQSLTKATRTERQRTVPVPRSMIPNRGKALTKLAGQAQVTALKNAHNMFPSFHRLQPVEYED